MVEMEVRREVDINRQDEREGRGEKRGGQSYT